MEKTELQNNLLNDIELLKFAKEFSEKYQTLNDGLYASDNSTYKIQYLIELEVETEIARISHKTGIIQLRKSSIIKEPYTKDFVFFLIIWCVACKEVKLNTLADEIATYIYIRDNRSKGDLIKGFSNMLKLRNNKENILRIRHIKNLIDKNE